MRFAFSIDPHTAHQPVVPALSAERVAFQPAPEPEPSRLADGLDQLDLDQRVRAIGEW